MDKVGVGKIGTKSVFRVMRLGKGGDWAHSFINQIKEQGPDFLILFVSGSCPLALKSSLKSHQTKTCFKVHILENPKIAITQKAVVKTFQFL